MVNYICIYKDVNLKPLLQHSVTWLAKACPPDHLCYYPEVFFCHLQLIALQKFSVHFKIVTVSILYHFKKLHKSETA